MPHPEALDGRFLWYELLTDDPEAAVPFYASVMGWSTESQEREGDAEPYVMWTSGGRPVAGVMRTFDEAREGGAPPHWLPYVGVRDVDEATARVVALGGNVPMAPVEIPGVGRIAVLNDRAGAPLAVFDPVMEIHPAATPARVGEISWHELATDDWRSALEFYGDLFGWTATEDFDMGEMGIYQMYGAGGVSYGGMYDQPEGPSWLVYGRVADLELALDRVRRGGGEVHSGPMEVPGGDLVAQFADPQGALFALHQMVGSPAAAGEDASAETAGSDDRTATGSPG